MAGAEAARAACPRLAFYRQVHSGWERGSVAKEEKQKLPRGSCPALTGALRYLKGLDEGPQQDADGVALAKQFDQPCRSEEAEEAQVDEVVLQRSSVVWNLSRKGQTSCVHPTTLPQVPVTPKEIWLKETKRKSLL